MSQNNIYEEWQKLCQEHDAARDKYFAALSTVNSKFSAIAQGNSNSNPDENELSDFDKTWQDWEGVKHRMSEFVKKHA
jgi:hypothetical protein